jgi:hypothetical protein
MRSLGERLRAFAHGRGWERYHTPKNRTAAVAGEAGELLAILQWATDISLYLNQLGDEIAARLIYVVQMCDVVGVEPVATGNIKIDTNEVPLPCPTTTSLRQDLETAEGINQ